jgi:hypothetical protein
MVGLSNYPMSATVTVHRVGLLDLTSMIERTIPVTGNPFNITTAVSPRYCAKRQRRASRGSVISIVCMQHRWSQYAIRFCDDQHRIREELTKTLPAHQPAVRGLDRRAIRVAGRPASLSIASNPVPAI